MPADIGYDFDPDPINTFYPMDTSVGATDADVLSIMAANRDKSQCYYNPQKAGSVVYQRLRDYHGPLFEIIAGYKHQGYGNDTYASSGGAITARRRRRRPVSRAAPRGMAVLTRLSISLSPHPPVPNPRSTATTTSAAATSRSTARRPTTARTTARRASSS